MSRTLMKAVRILFVTTAFAIGITLISISTSIAASTSLKTVTTQDQTVSVGLPVGWTLAKGSQGFVYVIGPNGERINLGVLVIGKNASSGSALSSDVVFAMPFSTSLKDKFTTIIQKGAANQGQPQPQITIVSQKQTKLPMCALFLGGWTAGSDSRKFEGVLCSLKPDYLGLYKNLMFLAQVPASRAAEDRPIVETIVQSYRVTPAMFKRMLAPYSKPPPPPAGGAMPAMPGLAPYQDPTRSDCFDYNVIRESPPWEMPMHCGGWQPG